MRLGKLAGTLALAGVILGGQAIAGGDVMQAVKARQELMQNLGKNIQVLGKMAKGAIPYDAAQATAAAQALASLAATEQTGLWPEGSDNFELDEKTTRAKPEIWENRQDFAAKFEAMQQAAEAMAAVAGGGLDSVRGALGPLGQSCAACHKAYRAPKAE